MTGKYFKPFSDVGESLNGAAVGVKDAVVGAVKSIGNGVDNLASDVEHKINEKLKNHKNAEAVPTDEHGEPLCKIIPLKDPTKQASVDEMDEFKDLLDKMTEEHVAPVVEETAETVTKAADGVVDSVEKVESKVNEMADMSVVDEKTPTHSLDSLATEPEIINATLNDGTSKTAPSPKPTLTEMRSIEEMDDVLNQMLKNDAEKDKL